MKIVQINAVYGTLSTGKIMQDIHRALLDKNNESFAFWATLCKNPDNDKNVLRVGNTLDHKIHALLYRIDKKQGWHSIFATLSLCRKLKKINPDVVHLHNLHSNYINLPILLNFLGKNNIPTVLTLHDCWFFTGQCTYYTKHNCLNWKNGCTNCKICDSNKKSELLLNEKKKLFNNITKLSLNGVSKWTADSASQSIISSAIIQQYIYNWIDTKTFHPYLKYDNILEKYKIPNNKKIILGVSQGWSVRKGLQEFIEISNSLKDEAVVVLVGENSEIPKRSNIKAIGFTNNINELAELYSAADVFVNPSRMETFGLVTAEALSCGTPVVAYANTGSLELVSPECGLLAQDGNLEDLLNCVNKILLDGKEKYSEACREYATKNFNKDNQIKKYIKLYDDLIHYDEEREYINEF